MGIEKFNIKYEKHSDRLKANNNFGVFKKKRKKKRRKIEFDK